MAFLNQAISEIPQNDVVFPFGYMCWKSMHMRKRVFKKKIHIILTNHIERKTKISYHI